MNITQFEKPKQHPYDLLGNYEKESNLAVGLLKAIEAGDLYAPILFNCEHPEMVNDGLFEKIEERTYKLTKKAVGLLYSVYGK